MALILKSVAQYQFDETHGGVPYNSADTVVIQDTTANLSSLTTSDISSMVTNNVDTVDSTNNVLTWNVAQWEAVPTGLGFDVNDLKVVADTNTNISAITTGDLTNFNTYGVTLLSPGAGTTTFSVAQYEALGGISFDQNATVTLTDTGAHISAMSAAEFGALSIKGFDHINASDNAFNLSVAQYEGLNGVTIDGTDTVTLVDTGANIDAMTPTQIAGLIIAGVSSIDASDNSLTFSLAQFNSLNGVTLTQADDVTLADTGANLASISATQLGNDGGFGVDHLDATDNVLNLTVAQAQVVATGGEIGLTNSDNVTLNDSGANLAAVSAATYTTYANNGIDHIDATNDAVSFTIAQLNAISSGEIGLTASDVVTLFDTAANIDTITDGQLSGFISQGVDIIDASDNGAYSFDVAGAVILEGDPIHLASNDTVTLADTGANISGMSVAQIGGLAAEGFDIIDASTPYSLTVAQFDALGSVALTLADTVTLADTGANLAALSAGEMGALGEAGIDIIDATDDALSLTVAQYSGLIENGVALTGSDTVTLSDSGANISAINAGDLAALGENGIDIIDASDDAYNLTVAQAQALEGTGVTLASNDVVTVADTEANIEALTAGDLTNLANQGLDRLNSSNDILNLNVNQAEALGGEGGLSIVAGDTATVLDTEAHIEAMTATQIGLLAGAGFDAIDATDNTLNLSVAQYLALGSVALTASDSVSLFDTGAALGALTVNQIAALAGNNVDRLNASDNVLALNVAQYNALGAVTLAGGDIVSIADTGAHLATLNFSTLASHNVDAIDATDNVLSLTVAQFQSLGTVSLAAGDFVTIADTSANIEALSGAQLLSLGGKGVDQIDTTDNVLVFSLNQFNNLGAVTVAANDVFTISDTEAHLEGVTVGKLAALNTAGVDFLDSQSGVLNLTVAQAEALNNIKVVGGDTATVLDTGANIAGMSAGQISQLASHNIDAIDSSTDLLTLSTGQFNALGSVALTQADTVTLADTGSLLATLNFAQLAAKGIDILDATDDTLNLTVAQYMALGSVQLTGADTVTLLDTGTNLGNLTASQIGALGENGIDVLNSTTDLLTLNVAQFDALGEVGLTAADVVTVADTGANLAGMGSDVSLLGAAGVDRIDATDNVLNISKVQMDLLVTGNVALTASDVVTMSSGEASLEALTPGNLATYAAEGVDFIDSGNDVLNLDAAQVSAMANTGLKDVAGDDFTVVDSSANVIANLGALFGSLAGTGVDHIDLTDNAINLTVSQATALNGVNFDASDFGVVVLDSGADLETLTAAQIVALGEAGIDGLDATDDAFTFNAAQAQAVVDSGIIISAGDVAVLSDTGAHIASLSGTEIHDLASAGFDNVLVSNHAISLNVAQFQAFTESFAFQFADTVTVKGNQADNTLIGGNEMDVFRGQNGNDVLSGGGGKDTITGGLGADTLTGGTGSDTFVFTSLNDSVSVITGPDHGHSPLPGLGLDLITDLTNNDVIDLSQIDADSTIAGDQAFHLVNKFTHHAGELMVKYNASADQTLIKMDVDGDGHADSVILVSGNEHNFTNFVL